MGKQGGYSRRSLAPLYGTYCNALTISSITKPCHFNSVQFSYVALNAS